MATLDKHPYIRAVVLYYRKRVVKGLETRTHVVRGQDHAYPGVDAHACSTSRRARSGLLVS